MAGIAGRLERTQFVTIWSRNLAESRKFYIEKLGLKLLDETENEFFQFEIAGTPVCVDYHADRSGKESNQFGVETSDLTAVRTILESLGIAVREGQRANEEWMAISDPDGHEIIFLSSIAK